MVSLLVGSGPAAVAATTSPTFTRTDYPFIGNQVAGDFNGDGRLDLAGLGYLVQAAQVRLNTGGGSFGPVADYPAPWGQDIATGDFNGDGRLDLVLTHNDPQVSLSLLTGNGDGTFNAPVSFPNTSGFDSPWVTPTDLNNDGRLDLVVAHNAACFTAPCVIATTVSIMIGNGDGTFQPTREVEVGRGTGETAVGDFNRDGNKDLAIAGSSSQLFRLFGNGDGTFVQQPTLTLTPDTFGVQGTDVDVADFNGDTLQDLVVAIGTNGSRTAVLIGNGDGTFRAPLIITEPNQNIPQYTAVADYNGDGFQDLALSLGDGNTGLMEILNGNGDGTFQPRVMYVPPPPISVGGAAIVAADFSGDGKADIALGRSGAFPGFLVLVNSTGTAPPTVPSAPTLLSPANAGTPAQPVTLDWSDVSAATSYRVQIDDSSTISSPFVVDQTVTASQLTAPTLAVKQYWWRVRGINSAGTAGAWSSVRRFTPQAPASAPALNAIALSPASVVGGNPSQGTATLTGPAPTGGAVVTLSSSNTGVATVPASVTVPAGATSRTFTVTTSQVSASTSVSIGGAFGGTTRSSTLTVTPPAPPGQSATLTVTATGRSGERVTSSPAGINVAVGSTGSAPFTAGTSITLTVTNGREAVWSGACSSGGARRRTCTFTLGGNAAVTANVQ
ncbi:MAG: FG-GAP-like repeat-containing protein [Acidimicrobiales bacterium]